MGKVTLFSLLNVLQQNHISYLGIERIATWIVPKQSDSAESTSTGRNCFFTPNEFCEVIRFFLLKTFSEILNNTFHNI